jgi:lipopolysaccharide/colanic/teichoic acid biosynthesis glycosyltransferase
MMRAAVSRPGRRPQGTAAPPGGCYGPCKRTVEVVAALGLLVLLGPVIGIVALLVTLTSRGPAFYIQTRLGRHGRHFPMVKLRTMYDNCEAVSGICWSRPGDRRITPLGELLRRTHVDELPQLLNVLLGHMSLVGPRPERPEFLPVLEQALAGYRDRLKVRPGVTGLAQVQLPPDTDLASVKRKLTYDVYYIERMGPWLDFRIVLATVAKVFGTPLPVTRALFGLPRQAVVEQAQQTPRDKDPLRKCAG